MDFFLIPTIGLPVSVAVETMGVYVITSRLGLEDGPILTVDELAGMTLIYLRTFLH
jgi:hypothetical protein